MKWIIVILTFVIAGLTSSCLQVFTPEPVQGLVDTTSVTTATNSVVILETDAQENNLVPEEIPTATPILEQESTAVPEKVKPSENSPVPIPALANGIEVERMDDNGGLNLVVESGAHWIRRNALFWSSVEPDQGERNWEALQSLEAEMINAAEAGLEVILIVRRTPTWAQKFPGIWCGPVAEEAIDEFAQFMAEAVERYSAPPYNVIYWEVGNEPDIDPSLVDGDEIYGCWGDKTDAYYGGGYYAEVLKQVYPAVKKANPEAQLLVGGLLLDCDPINPPVTTTGEPKDCTSSKFLEGILLNGGGDYFDGVSYHAYDYYWSKEGWYKNTNWDSSWDTTGPVLSAKADFLNFILRKNGFTDKYLMSTESAVLCGSTGKEADCNNEAFNNTKSKYAAQANATAAAKGIRTNIWYSIYGWRSSGLISAVQTKYPAFTAYQFNSAMLKDSLFSKEVIGFPGIYGFEFTKEGSKWWIIWGIEDEKEISIQLPAGPKGVYDLFGSELPASRKLQIGTMPVYIQFEPVVE